MELSSNPPSAAVPNFHTAGRTSPSSLGTVGLLPPRPSSRVFYRRSTKIQDRQCSLPSDSARVNGLSTLRGGEAHAQN